MCRCYSWLILWLTMSFFKLFPCIFDFPLVPLIRTLCPFESEHCFFYSMMWSDIYMPDDSHLDELNLYIKCTFSFHKMFILMELYTRNYFTDDMPAKSSTDKVQVAFEHCMIKSHYLRWNILPHLFYRFLAQFYISNLWHFIHHKAVSRLPVPWWSVCY